MEQHWVRRLALHALNEYGGEANGSKKHRPVINAQCFGYEDSRPESRNDSNCGKSRDDDCHRCQRGAIRDGIRVVRLRPTKDFFRRRMVEFLHPALQNWNTSGRSKSYWKGKEMLYISKSIGKALLHTPKPHKA